jgi:PAS domain S-box-containing protein
MNELLRIIHLEDDPKDADLVKSTLAAEGIVCDIRIAATYDVFAAALAQGIDMILADLAFSTFDTMTALAIVREKDPEFPFIFVTERQGEEAAIESLKSGATDYVLKNHLSRLGPAIKRALSETYERAERRMAELELRRAYSEKNEIAESYQNLFTSIRDLIVVTDQERTILHVNHPALKEIFGYELEEAEGKSVGLLYADEEEYVITGRASFGLSDSVKGKTVEVNLKRKSGEIFIGELSLMRRLDRRGLPSGNIGIFRDISERKRAEESLRESEMRHYQLQVELACAADIQAKLLPRSHPLLKGFEIAAHCLPAHQVGGDFLTGWRWNRTF